MDKSAERQKKGHEAYLRGKIKLGDKFRWTFSDGYGTSGKLKKKYIPVSSGETGEKIMTIESIVSGRNGLGYYADFELSNGKTKIRINGYDALGMERA